MTKPVPNRPRPKRHPTPPIPMDPEWGVGAEGHRPNPKVVVQTFWNLIMLIQLVQVAKLAIDILEGVTAGMNCMHFANSSIPNPFA